MKGKKLQFLLVEFFLMHRLEYQCPLNYIKDSSNALDTKEIMFGVMENL